MSTITERDDRALWDGVRRFAALPDWLDAANQPDRFVACSLAPHRTSMCCLGARCGAPRARACSRRFPEGFNSISAWKQRRSLRQIFAVR